jgi:hypothetical protein
MVYDVQKEKFKGFSSEIQIFESIYADIYERSEKTEKILKEKKVIKKKEEIWLGMHNEDMESHNNELRFKEIERECLVNRIGAIERTYPKEFEYLYQDLVLKKELIEVINEKAEIDRKLKYKNQDRQKIKMSILKQEEKIDGLQNKKILLNFEIDEAKNDVYYTTMETYLENNVCDVMKFEKLKLLIQGKLLLI